MSAAEKVIDMLESARSAYECRLCVLPPTQDGQKRPMVPWRRYEDERPTWARLERWYRAGLTGIGTVCGPVSGNLIMLEAETDETAEQLRRVATMFGAGDVMSRLDAGYLERTPGGGVHWLLRCSELGGNTKLASRLKTEAEKKHEHDKRQVLIETREAGGYTINAPSHGHVHASGRPYVQLAGGVDTIPVITPEEKALLWRAARDLDELPTPPLPPARAVSSAPPGGESVADRFNRGTTWAEVLEPNGWTYSHSAGGRNYWCRPGKTVLEGHSASTIEDVLYVFSSSTPFEPERGYSRFGAFAVLRHGGDMSAAAKSLMTWWRQAGIS